MPCLANPGRTAAALLLAAALGAFGSSGSAAATAYGIQNAGAAVSSSRLDPDGFARDYKGRPFAAVLECSVRTQSASLFQAQDGYVVCRGGAVSAAPADEAKTMGGVTVSKPFQAKSGPACSTGERVSVQGTILGASLGDLVLTDCVVR